MRKVCALAYQTGFGGGERNAGRHPQRSTAPEPNMPRNRRWPAPRGGARTQAAHAPQPLRALPIGGATTGSRCRYSSRQVAQPVNAEIGGGIAAIVALGHKGMDPLLDQFRRP